MPRLRTYALAAFMFVPSLAALGAQDRGDRGRRTVARRNIDTTFAFNKTGQVSLEMMAGDIRVTGCACNEARVLATSQGVPIEARFTSDAIALEIGRSASARYQLTVPIGVSVNVSSLSGSIVITGTKGEVIIETRSAAIEVSDVVGRGDFEAASGRMMLQRLDGRISVTSLSGPVSISEIKGALEIESTTGGTVKVDRADLSRLEFTTIADTFDFSGTLSADGRHQIETHGGAITLRFPEKFGATLEIETWKGQFHPVDFPVMLRPTTGGDGRGRDTQRQQFTINGGGTRISIETNIGDVYLRKIGAPPARREQ